MKTLKLAKQFIQSQGGYTGDPVTVIQKQQAEIATLRQRLAAAEAAQQQTRIDAFQELLDEIDESVYVECWGYIEQKRDEAAAALKKNCTCDVLSVMGGVMLGYKADCPVPDHAALAARATEER